MIQAGASQVWIFLGNLGFLWTSRADSGAAWSSDCPWGTQQEEHMANQMTKAQLVAALAERTGGDKKAAGAALEALTGIITETVAQGGAVTLPGVGKIYCRERPERTARNPADRKSVV